MAKQSWAAIDAVRAKSGLDAPTEKPANGFTVAEYAKHYDLPEPTARNHVAAMLASGAVTVVRVLLPTANAKRTPTNVYVPVPK